MNGTEIGYGIGIADVPQIGRLTSSYRLPNILLISATQTSYCAPRHFIEFEDYRNHPDESITPLLKEKSWAPVVFDPSHSVGKALYVETCSMAAVAYGADSLSIETNIDSVSGFGDDPKQAINLEAFRTVAGKVCTHLAA